MEKKHKSIDNTALTLLVIGGLNWGFTLFNFNLVDAIANYTVMFVGTLIYALIGLSGLWVGIKALRK